MRKTFMTFVLMCFLFSLACNSNQPNANSNSQTPSNANQSAANPSPMPSSAASTQPNTNQPTASPQANAPLLDPATAPARAELSMHAIEVNSARMMGDKAKLATMLADDYKGTRSDGTVVNKAQELASVKKAEDMLSGMEAKSVEINGDTATIVSELSYSKKDNPGVKVARWFVTDTLKQRKGKWVVVASLERKP
jgi:hypothetical protein